MVSINKFIYNEESDIGFGVGDDFWILGECPETCTS